MDEGWPDEGWVDVGWVDVGWVDGAWTDGVAARYVHPPETAARAPMAINHLSM